MNALIAVLLIAAPTISSVEYDARVDFSSYATWSWHADVTPAANLMAQKRVRETIETSLASRGLAHVDGGGALLVAYHAAKTVEIGPAPVGSTGASTPTGLRYVEKGSLIVEIVDAASRVVVWRGYTSGVMEYGPSQLTEQVRGAVARLLDQLPPSLRRAVP